MPHDSRPLQAITEELQAALEDRIAELSAHVLAAQQVNRQLASTEAEIRRQEALHEQLSDELQKLNTGAERLTSDNERLTAQVEKVKAKVRQMKKLRADLMSSLSDVSGEVKTLSSRAE